MNVTGVAYKIILEDFLDEHRIAYLGLPAPPAAAVHKKH